LLVRYDLHELKGFKEEVSEGLQDTGTSDALLGDGLLVRMARGVFLIF
jgi:hypothetical protein